MGKSTNVFPVQVVLVVLSLVSLIAAFVFSFLSSAPVNFGVQGNTTAVVASDLFTSSRNYLSQKYPSNIGPASWVFVIIWPTIFLWNTASAFYMFAALFLPENSSPIKRDPALISIVSLVLWSLSWAGSTAWLFAYDRQYIRLSLFFLIFTALTCYGFLAFSYRNSISDPPISGEENPKMFWLVRILVHNGYAIYTTWITCAWKLNLSTVIIYAEGSENIPADFNGSLTAEDGGTIALCLLLVEVIVWFILENIVFEKYCRYTLTVYPVLIFAFSGIFVKNYVYPYSRNQALTLAGLVIASVALIARIILVIIRHKNRQRIA